MLLWDSIRRWWKQDVIVKSIIWNTIIDIFNAEKSIDITSFLSSIQLLWDIVLIKTNKPIINSELIILSKEIKKASVEKLQKLWLRFKDFEIKYK
jgi:hypothetical protein